MGLTEDFLREATVASRALDVIYQLTRAGGQEGDVRSPS